MGISGGLAVGTPLFSYYQGSQAFQLNNLIYADVMSKSLHAPMAIEPGHSIATLLFVPRKCYNTRFNARLMEATSQEFRPYDIAIEEGE